MGLLGRPAAVLAAGAAAAHTALAVVQPSPTAFLMLPLAAACAVCARHLWAGPGPRTWAACAVLDMTMLALMLLVHGASATAGGAVGDMAGMHHGGSALGPGSAAAAAVLMTASAMLVAAQLVLVAAVGTSGAALAAVRTTGWAARSPVGGPGPG